jgi:hypothetical protein
MTKGGYLAAHKTSGSLKSLTAGQSITRALLPIQELHSASR